VELGAGLEGEDAHRELGHGVGRGGGRVEDLLGGGDDGGVGAGNELGGEGLGLGLGRDVAGEEKPEHGLGERLAAGHGVGELGLALGDGEAAEADALLGVEERRLVDERADVAHAAVGLLDGGVGELLVAVLGLELLDLGGELGVLLLENGLELIDDGSGRRGAAGSDEGSRGNRGLDEATKHIFFVLFFLS
jgi:hypothetical protein